MWRFDTGALELKLGRKGETICAMVVVLDELLLCGRCGRAFEAAARTSPPRFGPSDRALYIARYIAVAVAKSWRTILSRHCKVTDGAHIRAAYLRSSRRTIRPGPPPTHATALLISKARRRAPLACMWRIASGL